jgi:hypothetical protein
MQTMLPVGDRKASLTATACGAAAVTIASAAVMATRFAKRMLRTLFGAKVGLLPRMAQR